MPLIKPIRIIPIELLLVYLMWLVMTPMFIVGIMLGVLLRIMGHEI